MIKPFFDFLATKLSLTPKTDWHFLEFPPTAPDNGTMLGEFVGARVDEYNNNQRWPRYQFLTRNTSKVAGHTEANRIVEAVLKLRGEVITGHYIYDVTGSLPAYIGTDEKGRHLFSANVSVSARKE